MIYTHIHNIYLRTEREVMAIHNTIHIVRGVGNIICQASNILTSSKCKSSQQPHLQHQADDYFDVLLKTGGTRTNRITPASGIQLVAVRLD